MKESYDKKIEEYEVVKQIVVDRDRKIKKIEELNKKEIGTLKLEKKAAEDALGRATEESTKYKEKENTLLEVFKCMKQLMDSKLPETDSPASVSNHKPHFVCEKCNYTFTSEALLNDHQRIHE